MTNVSKLRIHLDDPAAIGFPIGISKGFELKTWSSNVNEPVVNVRLPPEVSVVGPELSTLISILLIITTIIVLIIDK